jgi:hypothetical protein
MGSVFCTMMGPSAIRMERWESLRSISGARSVSCFLSEYPGLLSSIVMSSTYPGVLRNRLNMVTLYPGYILTKGLCLTHILRRLGSPVSLAASIGSVRRLS